MNNKRPKLLVCSARAALQYVFSHFSDPETGSAPHTKEQYAAISIQDTGNWNFGFTLNQNRYCTDVLTLYFDDCEEPGSGVTLMSEKQAAQIIHFLLANQSADVILIHCYAGQSRSAAVARFAEELYGMEPSAYPNYNTHVYDLLCTVRKRQLS